MIKLTNNKILDNKLELKAKRFLTAKECGLLKKQKIPCTTKWYIKQKDDECAWWLYGQDNYNTGLILKLNKE